MASVRYALRFQSVDATLLSETQLEQISSELQRLLSKADPDQRISEWQNAPGTLESLQVDDDGVGALVLMIEGNEIKIPFQPKRN